MEHVLGQSRAIDQLQALMQSGRVHHAYIFHGPPGVGKFTAALAFAKLLLCQTPQSDLTGRLGPCGTCQACKMIARDMHPDLHVVTKELAKFSDDRLVRERKLITIPVDVLRDHLLEPVTRKSQLQHGKVFIVDEAELLNPTGQNLLLKTLEEPPPQTYLILVTASEDRLLPTIRSRCQRIAFVPLGEEVIQGWLDEQDLTLGQQQRDWLVDFAAGSLGRAKLAIDYELWSWGESILPGIDMLTKGRVDVELGGTIAKAIDTFAQAVADKDKQASKAAANKLGATLMLSMIGQHARRRIAELSARCSDDDPLAAEAMLEPWLGAIDALGEMEDNLAANVNLAMACDQLVMQIAHRMATASA